MPKTAQDGPTSAEDQLVREGDIAGDYLERLLDVLDYDGDIDLDVEAGRAIVSIDGGEDLDKLVGERGPCSRRYRSSPGSRCSRCRVTAAV